MAAYWLFRAVLLLVCLHSLYGCQHCGSLSGGDQGYTQVTYSPTHAQIINPERGGAIVAISFASNPSDLSESTLTNYRQTKHINIIWRLWYLNTFLTSPISTTFLKHIRADFNAVRAAGFKVTFRFAYTDNQNAANREADLPQMLAHIAQLKPIFHEYEDVILSVQAGFIGVWGEWYYSTYFGDAGVVSNSNWQKRKTVVAALLDAVPESRMIHLRTPAFKRAITGSDLPLSSSSYRNRCNNGSRLGHHNDCFLASSTDFGTYGDVAVDYPYLKQDTKYTVMGGETCNVNRARSKCKTAEKEMAMFHWTFLNLAYRLEVVNGWKKEGCCNNEIELVLSCLMEVSKPADGIACFILTDPTSTDYKNSFSRLHTRHISSVVLQDIITNANWLQTSDTNKLGYRLSLVRSVLPNSVASRADACFLVEFKNEGYAPPINPRDVRLVLIGSSGKYTSSPIKAFSAVEPWLAEDGTISVRFSLSMSVAEGEYDVMLELNDPLKYGEPDYNMLLANKGVGDVDVGLNHLLHKIQVTRPNRKGSCDQMIQRRVLKTSDKVRCYSGCQDLQVN